MAPQAARRKGTENQFLFDVGTKGRKTGLTVPDTGIRDENGLEPMDHLFSSPEKPKERSVRRMNGASKNANTTISSESDMDVGESTIPEPEQVLTERRASMRLPPPRSKSPIKTFLQSPARRNPSMAPASSPVRGAIHEPKVASVSASVRRKLDFSNASFDSNEDGAMTNGEPQKRGGSELLARGSGKLTNGKLLAPPAFSDEVDEVEQDDTGLEDIGFVGGDDSMQMINGGDDEAPEQEEEQEQEESPQADPEPEPQPSRKGKGKEKATEVSAPAAKRGRPKKALQPVEEEAEEEPVVVRPMKRTRASLDAEVSPKRKMGRPKKTIEPEVPKVAEEPEEPEEDARPKKKTRRSLNVPEAEAVKPKNLGGRPKKAASGPVTMLPKVKAPPRKPKLAAIPGSDSPQIQRGPPMPRNNRGLFILRRETPAAGSGFQQTRSGRNSIKPLAFWKNERIEYSEDENEDGHDKFVMSRIKEVVRAEEIDQPRRKAYRSKSKAPKSKRQTEEPESEEDDEADAWEMEPGRIFGEVRSWDPEDPSGSQAEEIQEEIALSSAAIITRDIPGASFQFAKTLTLPFFGSGMVDLPAKSKKKSKNSRKMQMVFFVFYGRVQVTVNDNVFSIGKGGMWQVPRGNFYSIDNDYDKPARIFFSQGCEIEIQEEAAESQ